MLFLKIKTPRTSPLGTKSIGSVLTTVNDDPPLGCGTFSFFKMLWRMYPSTSYTGINSYSQFSFFLNGGMWFSDLYPLSLPLPPFASPLFFRRLGLRKSTIWNSCIEKSFIMCIRSMRTILSLDHSFSVWRLSIPTARVRWTKISGRQRVSSSSCSVLDSTEMFGGSDADSILLL